MTIVKFLHTADWQLGMRRHFLGEEALPRFMQARVDAIRTIGELVARHDCQFAVVCGDVWESNQLDRRTVGRALEALASVPCPVYLLPGNHDPLDAGSIYRSPTFVEQKPTNVQVLDSPDPVRAPGNVELVPAPWPTRSVRRDLVAEACARLEAPDDVLRVCVGHGIVDTLAPDRDDPSLISKAAMLTALDSGRVHYIALGDRHSTTQVAERVWYSGSPEPTDYTEVNSGNVIIVELSRDRCTVTPHRTGEWRFLRQELTFSSAHDVQAARQRLHGIPDKEVSVLKLTLKGSLSLAAKAELDALLGEAQQLFGALEIWGRHTDLVVLPDDLDLEQLGLAGFARATVDALQEQVSRGGEGAAQAQDALVLLYRMAMRT